MTHGYPVNSISPVKWKRKNTMFGSSSIASFASDILITFINLDFVGSKSRFIYHVPVKCFNINGKITNIFQSRTDTYPFCKIPHIFAMRQDLFAYLPLRNN